MKNDKIGKKYYLQLRAEGNVVRMVEYAGSEITLYGKLIYLMEKTRYGGCNLYVVKRDEWLENWRTWNHPPLLEWIKRPWKEAAK